MTFTEAFLTPTAVKSWPSATLVTPRTPLCWVKSLSEAAVKRSAKIFLRASCHKGMTYIWLVVSTHHPIKTTVNQTLWNHHPLGTNKNKQTTFQIHAVLPQTSSRLLNWYRCCFAQDPQGLDATSLPQTVQQLALAMPARVGWLFLFDAPDHPLEDRTMGDNLPFHNGFVAICLSTWMMDELLDTVND